MKNILKVAVLSTGLLVSVFANAAPTKPDPFSLGILESTDIISQTVGKGTFSDTFSFTLSAGSTYDLLFNLNTSGTASEKFRSFGYKLFTGTTGSAQVGNTGSFSSNLAATSLASGNYRLSIYGKGLENDSKYFKATGSSPSLIGIGIKSYAIASPPSVSPVPEPETYAMLLAGLGLMGAIARRRNAKQA